MKLRPMFPYVRRKKVLLLVQLYRALVRIDRKEHPFTWAKTLADIKELEHDLKVDIPGRQEDES